LCPGGDHDLDVEAAGGLAAGGDGRAVGGTAATAGALALTGAIIGTAADYLAAIGHQPLA
jgi:hypothetical protein